MNTNLNYYSVPIYALNEIAKSLEGGRFVTIDEDNHLVLHYTPLTKDIWITNVYDVNKKGILVNIDTSGDGDYWSIPRDFMKLCNEAFTFKKSVKLPNNIDLSDKEFLILTNIKNHFLDGIYDETYIANSNTLCWYEIKDNKITRYSQKKYGESLTGNPKIIETWENDEEIIYFIKRNGWMLNNKKVIDYSLIHIAKRITNEQ